MEKLRTRNRLSFRALIFALWTPALLLTGCATPHGFPAPTSNWENSIGQLHYTNPKRSAIGEALVVQHGERQFQFEFTTGPVSMMKLQMDGDVARVESAVVPIPWQGRPDHAPKQLRSWLALEEVFTQIAKQPKATGHTVLKSSGVTPWKAEADLAAGKLSHLRVEFPQTREQFVFHFAH